MMSKWKDTGADCSVIRLVVARIPFVRCTIEGPRDSGEVMMTIIGGPATQPDAPADWATDFDHTHPDYAACAPEIWEELRGSCPVAHTDRFGGAWLPVRHDDVAAIARDTEHFTSKSVIVNALRPGDIAPVGYAPPITSDPPFHEFARRLLLPAFSPKAVEQLRPDTEAICDQLIDEILESGADVVDAAVAYAQHIPVRVIAKMLGLPESDGDLFRTFIYRILEHPGQVAPVDENDTFGAYIERVIDARRAEGSTDRSDLIAYLMNLTVEGEPLRTEHVGGTIALLILAGIDTTWSTIGASLLHLATHPDDRRRLVDDPSVWPTAIEEFLRFYAPVTMARLVSKDVEIGGCPMTPEDWVLLPFPAANRDPEVFDDADQVILDRARNRHAAFGLGIHRCIGSNLARMELTVALQRWMARLPEFELAESDEVRWSTGQVRGPRCLPLRLAT